MKNPITINGKEVPEGAFILVDDPIEYTPEKECGNITLTEAFYRMEKNQDFIRVLSKPAD